MSSPFGTLRPLEAQLPAVVTNSDNVPQLSGDPLLIILQNIFHYESFRGVQRQVIEAIARKKDTLAIIPTGGGKSVCYWIPGLATPGVTIVITPLMALLNDQVAKLRACGINVSCVHSSLSTEEKDIVFHELSKDVPEVKFFYLTPEYAISSQATSCFAAMVSNNTLARFVIDEAHCLDMWGRNFRPAYGQLVQLKKFGQPVAAFTGTATKETKEKIMKGLGMVQPDINPVHM